MSPEVKEYLGKAKSRVNPTDALHALHAAAPSAFVAQVSFDLHTILV